jgi:phage I-like protein
VFHCDVKPLLVTAFASLLPDGGATGEIVYLPEGEHTITPFVNGKAKQITVRIPAERGEEIAASLQADLMKRQAGNVRPWFDFEHKGGKSSALPQSFRYEPGKGVMCSLEWTGAGRAAIEGKDFSYFSPTFLMDENGTPAGLPDRGPLGALVNEPAFREIPRIAASDAAESSPIPPRTMKLLLAKLGIDPAHESAEQSALAKVAAMDGEMTDKAKRIAELEAELAELKKSNDMAEAKLAEANKARLGAIVEAAVAAGKIAPKDEATKGQVLSFLEANEALGAQFIAALPAKFDKLDQPIAPVKAADATEKELSPREKVEAAIAAEEKA